MHQIKVRGSMSLSVHIMYEKRHNLMLLIIHIFILYRAKDRSFYLAYHVKSATLS